MRKQKGFTLAELLITTVIIAFILTLFAPILTKRAVENMKTASSAKNSRLYIYDELNPLCEKIPSNPNTLNCKFTVPSGVNKINVVALSGGGGGAGARSRHRRMHELPPPDVLSRDGLKVRPALPCLAVGSPQKPFSSELDRHARGNEVPGLQRACHGGDPP